jgi:hypothetical protein
LQLIVLREAGTLRLYLLLLLDSHEERGFQRAELRAAAERVFIAPCLGTLS